MPGDYDKSPDSDGAQPTGRGVILVALAVAAIVALYIWLASGLTPQLEARPPRLAAQRFLCVRSPQNFSGQRASEERS
jgi:hypothetical protein